MTRKSRREIERAIDDLGGSEEFTVQEYLWADLKDYYGESLTPGEQRLLEDPDAHLPPSAKQRLRGVGGLDR